MNILHVTSVYYPELQFGGQPFKVHSLSKELSQRTHRVQVASFHSQRPDADECKVLEGIPVQYLPWVGRGKAQLPYRLSPLRRQIRASDLVHTFGLYTLLVPLAALLAWFYKRPFIVEPLGMYGLRSRNQFAKRLYHLLITRWLFQKAAIVIATSPTEYEELQPVVPDGKLVLRRNGLDLSLFRPLADGARFRERRGIPPTDKVIVFMGRVSPIKNLELLIRAFKWADLSQAHLLIVGPIVEPDYQRQLLDLIDNAALSEQITFTGPLYDAEKLEALAASDLFVLPSHYESYGNAAAEAVAVGVPVLLTENCGIAPTIDGRAGLAVSPAPDSMAAGIRTLLEDPATACARRNEVLSELSWDEPVAIMEDLYRDITGATALEATLHSSADTSRLPLSVVILTHDEEQRIVSCLESVTPFADEIFIVDSGSTDQTLTLARDYDVQIVQHPFENYADQRNWAQDTLPLRNEWVFHLDASERVTPELATALRRFFSDGTARRVNGALIARRTIFLGRWIRHGGHYPVYHSRLFRRQSGRCETRLYDQHFVVQPPLVRLEGDLADLVSFDLDAWSRRHLHWATLEASEDTQTTGRTTPHIQDRPLGNPIEQRRWLRQKVFRPMPLFVRAFGYFIYRYIFRRGFLDGTEGLIFHFLQGCWFRFYVDAKIWEARHRRTDRVE